MINVPAFKKAVKAHLNDGGLLYWSHMTKSDGVFHVIGTRHFMFLLTDAQLRQDLKLQAVLMELGVSEDKCIRKHSENTMPQLAPLVKLILDANESATSRLEDTGLTFKDDKRDIAVLSTEYIGFRYVNTSYLDIFGTDKPMVTLNEGQTIVINGNALVVGIQMNSDHPVHKYLKGAEQHVRN